MAVANLYKSGGELHFSNNVFLWFVENTVFKWHCVALISNKKGQGFWHSWRRSRLWYQMTRVWIQSSATFIEQLFSVNLNGLIFKQKLTFTVSHVQCDEY